MAKSLFGILSLIFSISVQAAPDLKAYLNNKTFDGNDNEKHFSFIRYFSDYGMVISTYPGLKNITGRWTLQKNRLCISWKNSGETQCYLVRIEANSLMAYKTGENATEYRSFTLTNPKKGNRFNKLNAMEIAKLDAEMDKETRNREPQTQTTQTADSIEQAIDVRKSSYTVFVGASSRNVSFTTNTNDKYADNIIEDGTISPSILVRTPYTYFTPQSRFGWFLEGGYSYFDILDECNSCEYYSESSSQGHYIYLAPTLFFSISNPWIKSDRSSAWKVGFGIGPAYLYGEAYLDRLVYFQDTNPNVQYSAPGFITNFFFDYRLSLLTLRFRYSDSQYKDGTDKYRIQEYGVDTYLTFDF